MKKNLLIVNPGSGKQDFREKLSKIKTTFQDQHLDIFFTSKKNPSLQISEHLKYNEVFDNIIVLGGDGTLNAVINGMPNFQPTLSFIGNGTGNDAIKSIHGVTDFHGQLKIALSENTASFDLGLCNNRYFINGVGLGFDGEVVAEMLRNPSFFKGHWAYKYIVLKLIAFYRSQMFFFNIDDESFHQPVFSMTVANGSTFGGGFIMNPHAKTNDGDLDVVVIDGISIPKRLRLLPKVKYGEHVNYDAIDCYKAKSVNVKHTEILKAHIDGEPLQETSYQFRVAPSAIKFKIPPS